MLFASSIRHSRALVGAAFAITLSLLAFSPVAVHADAGPFGVLAGHWSGNGTLTQESGTSERIRCNATYDVLNDGRQVQLRLTCASDTYKFELLGNVNYNGGSISGSWTEATRNAAGSISGTASASQINVVAEGSSFSATVTVSTHGSSQDVTIRSRGTTVSSVSITMRRG